MTDIFLAITILAANLWMAWQSFKGLRIAVGTKSRVPSDVSAFGIPVPPSLSPKADELFALGFVKLGEAQLKIPTRSTPETVWVFVHPDRTVIAQLMPILMVFSSYYEDARLEMTFYPTGERIRSENFVADFVETSIQAAYEAHCHRLQDIPQKFGAPTQLTSVDDYIRLNVIWRRILGSRLQRRFLILDIAIIAAALYSVGIVLLAVLFFDLRDYLATGVFPSVQPLLVLLLPAVLIMAIRMIFNILIANRVRRAG
jgi:hypothetical protein